MQGQAPGKRHQRRLADSARFLKSLIAAPRLTGAVAPSGRALARAMAAAAGPPPHGLIVELGPGTGPVTRSLIEAGVARERLVAGRIRPRLLPVAPTAIRARQDHRGRRLRPSADARGIGGPADRGRRLQPAAAQPAARAAREAHRRRLRADGASGSVRPVHLRSTVALFRASVCANRYAAHRSRPILLNLPPARVWTYRLEAHAAERSAN